MLIQALMYRKYMKKIALLLITVILLGIVFSSCRSTEKCAAYGEAKNYRVESR
jgi:hypothetical protein